VLDLLILLLGFAMLIAAGMLPFDTRVRSQEPDRPRIVLLCLGMVVIAIGFLLAL